MQLTPQLWYPDSMPSPLSPSDVEPLLDHLGFGDPGSPASPSCWFLGIEESSAGCPPLPENLRIRRQLAREGLLELPVFAARAGFSLDPSPTPVWRYMWALHREWERGDGGCLDPGVRRRECGPWISGRLGRPGSGTLVGDLYPLPAPDAVSWPAEYRGAFPSREAYFSAVRGRRVELLRRRIRQHRPRWVACYGKGCWPEFRELLDGGRGEPLAAVSPWSAEWGRCGETAVVLTPFFGNGCASYRNVADLAGWLREVCQ